MTEVEDSLDLSLLRATVLDASPDVASDFASSRAEGPRLKSRSPRSDRAHASRSALDDTNAPSVRIADSYSRYPDSNSDNIRHAHNTADSRLLNDVLPQSPPIATGKQGKMTSGGTQRSDRTDPLSQWAYETTPGPHRPHVAGVAGPPTFYDNAVGQSRSLATSTTPFRTAPETKTYNTGDFGHVELELERGVNDITGLETQEDLPDLPLQDEEHITELFPSSQRFQAPKTPASNGRKRKRNDGSSINPFSTPNLLANPFGSSAMRGAGPLRMSQVFHASSPIAQHAPSDPLSSRPSPNLHDLERPATAHGASSPGRTAKAHRRAVTEPHTSWKSPQEQLRTHNVSSPLATRNGGVESVSDDDFGIPSSQDRRRAIRAAKDKASRQLRNVTAGGRAEDRSKLQSQLAQRRQAPEPSTSKMEETIGIAAGLNDSEEETEREDDLPASISPLEGDEEDELSETNKENIAVKPTPLSRPQIRSNIVSRLQKKQRSPNRHTTTQLDPDAQSEDELADTHISPLNGELWTRSMSQTTRDKTIADSQLSPRSKEKMASRVAEPLLRSTDDSSKVVCESQTMKMTASSPPNGLVAEKRAPFSSPLPPSSLLSRKVQISGRAAVDANGVASKRPEWTSSEPVQELRKKATTNGSSLSGPIDKRTPMRKPAQAISIPETTVVQRFQEARSASQVQPLSKADQRASEHTTQGNGVIHTAKPQIKLSAGQASSGASPESTQLSTGVAISQPMRLGDIGGFAKVEDEQDSISMSPQLPTNDDALYDEVMEKYSSPISARRKRLVRASTQRDSSKLPANPVAISHEETRKEEQSSAPGSRASSGQELAPPGAAEAEPILLDTDEPYVVDQDASSEVVAQEPQVTNRTSTDADTHEQQASSPPFKPTAATRKSIASHKRPQKRALAPISSLDDAFNASSQVQAEGTKKIVAARRVRRKQALRVLAYFNGLRAGFYPATCISVASTEPKFEVLFDDGNATQLSSFKVKPLDLQPGDSIRIDRKGHRNINYVVQRCEGSAEDDTDSTATDNNGNVNVVVHRPTAGTVEPADEIFPIAAVYLTNQTWATFKREFSHQDLANFSAPSGLRTPSELPSSPLRMSRSALKESTTTHLRGGGFEKSAGLFEGLSFVLTNIDTPSLREQILSLITEHGGSVLQDGLAALFLPSSQDELRPRSSSSAPGAPSSSSRLPSVTPSSPHPASTSTETALALRSEYKAQSVFLLATRHCRHTKYFQALALGIPCLSARWISHCVSDQALRPWRSYLLAAGTSGVLDGAVVSQTGPVPAAAPTPGEPATTARYNLPGLIAARPQVLHQHRVLLVRLPDTRADQLDAHAFLARALGAAAVQRAASVEHARRALQAHAAAATPFTLVVANAPDVLDTRDGPAATGAPRPAKRRKGPRGREGEDAGGGVGAVLAALAERFPGVRGVSTEFVIQSLILGRLL